jgi:hypothetical protein
METEPALSLVPASGRGGEVSTSFEQLQASAISSILLCSRRRYVAKARKEGRRGARKRKGKRTRTTGTTEGLLANNGTSRLVVDVVVTGGVAEEGGSLDGSGTVTREDATGKTVGGGLVDELAGLLEVGVLVDVGGKNGTEDLLLHGDREGVLGEDDGGLDEVTLRFVAGTTGDDLASLSLGLLDVADDLVERELRAVEGREKGEKTRR